MMVNLTPESSSMMPIAFHENRYQINEFGQILNLANNTLLKPSVLGNGYLKVGLANGDGTHDQQLVHILVAKHFLPNPYGHPQVNHKDGIKANCSRDNLEWCTAQRNIEHALETGLRPGYMSADDKETYLLEVLRGVQVGDLAVQINRTPETLHKMLRDTAKRLGWHAQWSQQMKENRRNAALRNLQKINSR